MKKFLITLIIILITGTSNVLGFTGITNVEYNLGFNEQILDNYLSRDQQYNNKNDIEGYWGEYSNDEGFIVYNSRLYFKNDNPTILQFNTSTITGSLSYITKGSYNLNATNIISLSLSTIIYNPYIIYNDSNATQVKFRSGSINIPAIYVTANNDGGITIYKPQNSSDSIHLEVRHKETNEILQLIFLNETTYDKYLTDNRFWTFTGEDVKALGLVNQYNYYIRVLKNGTYSSSTPVFTIGEKQNSGGGDTGGGDTGGGDTGGGNINTDEIEQELGNINDSIQQGNDYITTGPNYDENGELSEEQTRTNR